MSGLDSYFDDYGSDSNSGSNVWTSLINAGASIGQTALIASQAPQAIAPGSFVPAAGNANTLAIQTQAKTSMWLWIIALGLGAYAVIKLT